MVSYIPLEGGFMRILLRAIVMLAAVCIAPGSAGLAKETKLKAQDIVKKHLDAIGPAQKLAAIQTRVIVGRTRMKLEAGEVGPGASAMVAGTLFLASAGYKYRIALPFQYADYWGEQFVFDGAKTDVGFAYIQKRSPIGDFIYRYDLILEEGLFGGVLSTAWPLLECAERQPKLEYAGLKKMGEQQVHVLRYGRKKGQADLRIELFFDAQTFQHVRTAYNLALAYDDKSPALSESQPTTIRGNGTVVPQVSANVPPDDAGRQGAQYRLEEYFGGFKAVDGVTLPGHWNIIFERASGNKTVQREWSILIDQVIHDRPLDANTFVLEQRKK
jgi:hypothetical protein